MVSKMNDDTISRQAAIDALVKQTNLTWEHLKTIYPMLNVFEKLPSAERHGHWINDNHLIKCSICEKPIPLRRVVLHGEVMWEDNSPVKYCPNCGAKMDLEEE